MPMTPNEFSYDVLGNCVVGELVVVTDDTGVTHWRDIIIVVERQEDGHFRVISLTEQYEPHPAEATLLPDLNCLRFGTNWILEVDHTEESSPRRVAQPSRPGTWALDGNGWQLCVATSAVDGNGRFTSTWRTMNGQKTRVVHGAFFPQWRIWLTQADRDRADHAPFFQYPCR